MDKTTKTVLIVGGVGLAVYLLTRPRPTTYAPTPAYGYGQAPVPYGSPYGYPTPPTNTGAGLISAGASALNSLIPAFSNLFGGGGGGGTPTPSANGSASNLPAGYYAI